VQGRLDWPAGLHYRFFFSGLPASTGEAISRTAGIPASDDAWRDLVARANETALVIETGDAGAAQAAIRAYSDALRCFDEAHQVGIFEAGHDTLRQRSEEAGVVYKPCGAGGGDIGIAVATDRDRLDAFASVAVDTGFVPLGLQMDNTGVTRETTALQ
jgi:phosphomevalonate kinase